MLLFQPLYETPANISVMQSTPGDLYGPAPDYPITTTTKSTTSSEAAPTSNTASDESSGGVQTQNAVPTSTTLPSCHVLRVSDGVNKVTISGNVDINTLIARLQQAAAVSSTGEKYIMAITRLITFLPRNEVASFVNIPLELHHMILELILVNPILGDQKFAESGTHYGQNAKYELSPNILLVNKQLNKEGTPFLYAKNKYHVACLTRAISYDTAPRSFTILSTVTRYETQTPDKTPLICDIKSLGKVRSWKVVVGLRDTYPQNPVKSPWSLFEFCRAICHTPPESLEVKLIPRNMDTGILGSGYLNFETFVEPLRVLRNVPSVFINDALASDVLDNLSVQNSYA